jgi:hypothetical protein
MAKVTNKSIKAQVRAIQQNAKRVIKDKIPHNIERALTAVGVVVANKALEYTPLEYGILQNSQYQTLQVTPNGYSVSVGYTAKYAGALHDRTDWNPRPPDQKKGPAWNPNAKHHFLTDAADDVRVTINQIMLGDLQL